jgi:CubicO group peptidase (beta-lactamase class C family)
VPRDWILASTQPSAPTDAGESGYGYQWWIPNDASPREYMARGVYGQYIYINEPLGTVIVTTGADRAFREDGIDRANVEMFRQIARQP